MALNGLNTKPIMSLFTSTKKPVKYPRFSWNRFFGLSEDQEKKHYGQRCFKSSTIKVFLY